MALAFAIPLLIPIAEKIASAIGTEFEGKAVSAVKSATGIDITGDVTAVTQALQGLTPEQTLAMQQANESFETSVDADNTSTQEGAYQREESLADDGKAGLMSLITMNLSGWYIMVLLGFVVYWGLFIQIDNTIKGIIISLIVMISKEFFSYQWGASSSTTNNS